jgi:hypothetical protein
LRATISALVSGDDLVGDPAQRAVVTEPIALIGLGEQDDFAAGDLDELRVDGGRGETPRTTFDEAADFLAEQLGAEVPR